MVASARLRRVLASQAHRGRRLGMVPFFIIGVFVEPLMMLSSVGLV
jgi:hypothetical protein